MAERWLPIAGFEGTYEVSDYGNVRSVDRWRKNRYSVYFMPGKPVTQHPLKHSEHLCVFLYPRGSSKQHKRRLVHRLVLTAFVGECPEGYECLHADGNPTNNHLSNLRWGTRSENQFDSIRHGTHNTIAKAKSTHCRRGHEYNEENTYFPPGMTSRRCKQCVRDRLARKAA